MHLDRQCISTIKIPNGVFHGQQHDRFALNARFSSKFACHGLIGQPHRMFSQVGIYQLLT